MKQSIKGNFWIYGKHAVIAALQNQQREISKIMVTRNTYEILSDAQKNKYKSVTTIVSPEDINKILPINSVHQGIACNVAPLPPKDISDLFSAKILIMLDQVNDPQNVGSILRSAAAFGAGGVIMTKDNSVSETGALAKSSSGGLEKVPLVKVTNLVQAIKTLKEQGFWCLGMEGESKTTLDKVPHYEKTILILGSEGKGLRQLTRSNCDILASLPISDAVESLNVANAASIALYEISV